MTFDPHRDFVYSLVAAAPSPAGSGLSLTVTTGEGARFPNPATDGAFNVVVCASGQNPIWASGGNTGGNFEVVRVTGRSGDVLTITRAQDGSSARTIVVGDQVFLADLSKAWTDIEERLNLGSLATSSVVTDLPTERTPSTIANTKYNAFGRLVKLPDGKQVIWYRESTAHNGTSVFGIIRLITSTDEGQTWSAPITIRSEASVDLQPQGGGVTRTGRLVLFFGRYDPSSGIGGATYVKSLDAMYSDDEGVTWSTPTTFGGSANFGYTGGPYGEMIEIGGGKLMQSYYAWSSLVGGTKALYVTFSTDNGASWGGDVQVVSSSTVQYDESSFAYLGGSYIVGVTRNSNGTTFKQFQSADNGATWVAEGDTSFDSWTTPSPPCLVPYIAYTGRRMVACYYTNRDAGTLRVVTASATDLQTTAASAWGSPTTLLSGFPSTDFGYPQVVHPFGRSHGLGWLYKGVSSSEADMVFFASTLESITATGTAGGDLGGTYPSPTVAKINGSPLATLTDAVKADRLRFDGTNWDNSALIWRPLMALDPTTSNYVVVTASGNAVLVEA